MTPGPDLDTRLRTGLRAAAEAIPEADPANPRTQAAQAALAARSNGGGPAPGSSEAARGTGPTIDLPRPAAGHPGRRTALAALAAAVVVTVVAAGAVVLTAGDDEEDGSVATEPTVGPPTTVPTTDTTAGPSGVLGDDTGPGTDAIAGSAVIVDDEIVVYGPDGQPDTTVPLAPLTGIQAAVADRHGGWIACGMPPLPESATSPSIEDSVEVPTVGTGTTATYPPAPAGSSVFAEPDADTAEALAELEEDAIQARVDDAAEALAESGAAAPPPTPNAYRFQVGEDPVPLPVNVHCLSDSLSVTDVDGHTILYYVSPSFVGHQIDLTTGIDGPLPVDVGSAGLADVAVGGGRLALLTDTGLQLWDLATREPVAIAPVNLPRRPAGATSGDFTDDLELSPDGTTLAALVSDSSFSTDLVVFDLASGTELLRRPEVTNAEGSQLTFDGNAVAVGSFYDDGRPVLVIDVATGAERTIDTNGVLP